MKKLILAVMMLAPTVAMAVPGPFIQGQLGPSTTLLGLGVASGYLWGGNHFNYGAQLGMQDGFNIDALGIIQYTFDSHVLLFAKAGISYINSTKYDFLTYQKINQLSGSGFGPKFALGIGYEFNPRWEIDLDAEGNYLSNPFATKYYDKDNAPSIYTGGVFTGLTYHFV